MKFFSTKQRGFTLVELMIVIAIIGILASILIVSLRQASERSRNAKIITDIVQVRRIAEQIYTGEIMSGYTDLCKDSSNFNSDDYTDLGMLQIDIEKYGGAVSCYANSDSYCVSSSFRTSGQWFCVDDEGSSIEVTGDPCLSADSTCQ